MFKGIVGIECGGKNSVLSKIGRTGLETIQSESSSREIPCAVVFTETQRLFAEVAQDRIKAYYQQSVTYLFRLCAAEEIKRGYHSFQTSPDTNKAVIQDEQFDLEQLVGSFLTYLDSLIKNHLPINDSYVCAVSAPNYFTLEDKLRLQVACKIARLPCLGVISEHVAVGYSYLWFQKKDLAENSRKVLFVDVGDSQSNCFVYQFENHIGILQDLAVCRDLGVRDIDQAIYCFLQNKYTQVMQNISKKSELRVKEQIARTRKELSSNTESQFIVESVTGDHDLQHLFTREQLLKIVEENGLLNKLRGLIEQVGNIEGLDDIELLGGGSRIPIVQQTIKEVLKIDKLGVTFQSCETVSRGCAIACAVAAKSLNPLIKIEPYQIKGKLQENLSVELIVSGEVKVKKAYRKGESIPLNGSLSVILKENENAESVNVRFKEINEGEMEIIEKEMKNNENKEVPVETNEMDIEGEKQHKENEMADENALINEEENKNSNTEVTGDSNKNATQSTTLDSKSDSVRVLVDYWISESGIGGVSDGRQLVDQKGWQGLQVEIENIVTDERLIMMQVREKELKDRDASVRQVLEERNTLEAYLNSKLRYIRETLQYKVSEELFKTVETQLQGIEEEYQLIQEQICSEQIKEMLKRAKAAMDKIEITLKNDKKISFSANSISEVEDFVKGYKKDQRVKVDEFELKITGQAIGDGKGIFGIFKKSGAQKLKQSLECLQVNQSLSLQLGDNNLSENGLSDILNGIDTNEISEVSLELDSTAAGKKNQNKITDEGLVKLVSEFLTRVRSLTILSLTLNTPQKDLQILLEIIPSTLTSLKHLNLTLTNFIHDQQQKTQLEIGLLPRSHTLTLNCITPNGTLFH